MYLVAWLFKSSYFHSPGVGNTILLGYESVKHLMYQMLYITNVFNSSASTFLAKDVNLAWRS